MLIIFVGTSCKLPTFSPGSSPCLRQRVGGGTQGGGTQVGGTHGGGTQGQQPPKKHRRRLSDGGKAGGKKAISRWLGHRIAFQRNHRFWFQKYSVCRKSVSASCSPAVTRKGSLEMVTDTSINNDEDPSCTGAVSSMSNKVTKIFLKIFLFQVSDDINEMVEQIQAIQLDISELAGRPISLVGGSKR